MRLAISDGPSVCESQDSQTVKGMSIPVGTIVHGRVARPGEVDRYRVTVEKAKALSLRVQAGAMGSWLDSVVRVVDEKGATVAENDDVGVNNNVNINPFNSQPAESSDSRVEFTPRESGDLMIEVTDRYGAGGPEFGYQLQLGTSAPDFELSLLFGDPGLARRRLFGQPQQTPRGPGANGAINIKPGTSVPINFLVSSDGRIGKVEVRAEGLPEGVTAAPVTVNLAVGPKGRPPTPSSSGGALVLKAAPTARAVLGELRIVGTARIEANAAPIVRRGTARVLVDLGTPANGPNAPPLASWELAQLPVWVAGRIEDSSTGAARPEPVSLSGAEIPGVLLQGATIEIPLRLDPAVPPTGSYELTAESLTPRITAHTVVTENSADVTASPARVKVSAAADAPVGVANVTLRLTSGGKESFDLPQHCRLRRG
jgi:hypothetical protein